MATEEGYVPQPVHATEEDAIKSCNQWVESGLTKNKAIQFLVQNLIELGCDPPEKFIRCVDCPKPAAGGFGMLEEHVLSGEKSKSVPCDDINRLTSDMQKMMEREREGVSKLSIKPEIYLCQQYMEDELMTHKTLVHELIHAIDMCRTKMDPLRNCIHMACTEIRAENLSGECSLSREMSRMKSFRGHGQECVKRRAILSVRANPSCTARATEYVEASMPRCFQDVYPFDKHPNLR
jgi:mitochondrial inner membrane protease ATP23